MQAYDSNTYCGLSESHLESALHRFGHFTYQWQLYKLILQKYTINTQYLIFASVWCIKTTAA